MHPEQTLPGREFILPDHIDSTMINCARSCLWKFALEFGYGLRTSAISPDLHAGGCFALAVEKTYFYVYCEGMSTRNALDKAMIDYSNAWGDYEPPPKKANKAFMRVWEAVEDYFNTYPPQTDHIRPYYNADGKPTFEFSFAVPLEGDGWPLHPDTHEPFIYCGRFDGLGSYNGVPVIKDDKTTGYFTDTWAEQWGLRSQFLGYCWSMQQLGFDIDTVVVRGVAIQKTQIKQQEAIKTYSKHLISRWEEQTKRDLNRIVDAYVDGRFDYNLGESCTSYGLCTYFSSCEDRDPNTWLQDMVVSRWNPLNKV